MKKVEYQFEIGDRVRLVDLPGNPDVPDTPATYPWFNGNTGTVVKKESSPSGGHPPIVRGPTYGVRFDGFNYGANESNCHTPREGVLEHVVNDEDVAEAIRSIRDAL